MLLLCLRRPWALLPNGLLGEGNWSSNRLVETNDVERTRFFLLFLLSVPKVFDLDLERSKLEFDISVNGVFLSG